MDNQSCHTLSQQGIFTEAGFWTLWLSAIPLVVIFVMTLTANGAVIIMLAVKVKLRRCRNTYIMSLAVANFLIGLTLPVSVIETVGEEWIFSDEACTYFLTIRFSLYYVTVLSIILITADRWWSVNFPFSYRIRRSKKMALSLVATVWILSFVVHIPSIIGWNLLHVTTVKPHRYCRVPYEYHAEFTMSASVIEFFIPLILLISLNMGIYIKLARRRNSKKLRRSMSSSESRAVYGRKTSSDSSNNNGSDEKCDIIASLPLRGDCRRKNLTMCTLLRLSKERPDMPLATSRFLSAHNSSNTSIRRLSFEYANMLAPFQRRLSEMRAASRASISSQKKKFRKNDDMVRDFLLRQDNKALLSLALLVITFVVCWTPSILCDILYSFCPSAIPLWLLQVAYWILALSSSLNPFLYGIGSNDFRRMAKSWLCERPKQTRILESMLYNHFVPQCELISLKDSDLMEQRRHSSVNNNASYV